ncbi:MAG: VCBS repeat-containing protein [Anaerolineae bacterium]|nr:VCBS repeat-containing protein [Anaerolineae bacterium]
MPSGEWLQWRRDSQRTGRVPLRGQIRKPAVVASHFLGGTEDWLVLHPGDTATGSLVLPDALQTADVANLRREWELDRWIDVEGTGSPEKVTESHRERYLRLLPDKPGYQRLFFESCFDKGMASADTRGWLEERVNGAWQRAWTSPPDTHYWGPNVLLADVDGDGEEEIVITVHYRIIAFKAGTGEKVRELQYHHYRNYGEAHAVDLTGNGLCDFVVLAEFPAHAEVILNDGKEFHLAWYEDVQHGNITDADHALTTPYYPIADVDGDGQPEIVYSHLNHRGDGAWHTVVVEAVTGRVKQEMVDFVVKEILPAGPAGKPWLFGIRSDGGFIPADAGAAIYEIVGGEARLVWEDPASAWSLWTPYRWTNYRSCKNYHAERLASAEGGKVIWSRERLAAGDGRYRLTASRFASGKREIRAQVVLPAFDVQAVRPETDELLVTTRRKGGEIPVQGQGVSFTLLGSQRLVGRVPAPVVFAGEGELPRVVVPDLTGNVRALDFAERGQVAVRWALPGHGMANERGLCAGRQPDGSRAVVFLAANARGEARIVQADASGHILWTADIPRTHPALRPGNTDGGTVSLHTLPLRQAGQDDVLVTSLKNNMHSAFTCALAGENGRQVWRQDKSGAVSGEARGYGGSCPFAGLAKDDGTEDLVSEFPDLFYIADGKTGDFTVYNRTQQGCFFGLDEKTDVLKSRGALYGTPIVTPVGVVWGGCPWVTGFWQVMELGIGFRWFTAPQAASGLNRCPLQAIGDFGGSGRLQLIGWEFAKNALTCRDLEEGDLRWTLPLPGADAGQYYVTCDVDGDGREECILCTPDELVAVGERDGNGVVVWRLRLPAACTQPVVADADGDGLAEILLPCQDGSLYLVGAA